MKKHKCSCGKGFDTDNDGDCVFCASIKRKRLSILKYSKTASSNLNCPPPPFSCHNRFILLPEKEIENDWTRTAMNLDALREKLLNDTHGVFAGSDSVTVLTNTWVATILELLRIQKQCASYGEMQSTNKRIEKNDKL